MTAREGMNTRVLVPINCKGKAYLEKPITREDVNSGNASPSPIRLLEISVKSSSKRDLSVPNLSDNFQRQLDGETHPGCR